MLYAATGATQYGEQFVGFIRLINRTEPFLVNKIARTRRLMTKECFVSASIRFKD